jgi:hypothetical protein
MHEALKLLIIAVCLNCNTEDKDRLEYVKFYTDSISFAGQTWLLLSSDELDTYGDKIHKGIFVIKSKDGIKANITVAGKNVLLTIPQGNVNVHLYQIQHESEYYDQVDLGYMSTRRRSDFFNYESQTQ